MSCRRNYPVGIVFLCGRRLQSTLLSHCNHSIDTLNRYRAATGRPTHRYLYGGNFTNISPLYVHHPLWRFLPRLFLTTGVKSVLIISPPDRGSAPIISQRFPSSPGRTATTAAQGHRLSGPLVRRYRTCGLHLPAIRNMDCRSWDGRLHLGGLEILVEMPLFLREKRRSCRWRRSV